MYVYGTGTSHFTLRGLKTTHKLKQGPGDDTTLTSQTQSTNKAYGLGDE